MLCQGQRDFGGIIKDCENCEQKLFCNANIANLYLRHRNDDFVFALSEGDAKLYFKRGYGIKTKEVIHEQTLKEFRDFLGGE